MVLVFGGRLGIWTFDARFQIDDRNLVVGNGLFRIGRIYLGRGGYDRKTFIGRNRDARGWPDDARGHVDFSKELRWRNIQIDDGDSVRRRIGLRQAAEEFEHVGAFHRAPITSCIE